MPDINRVADLVLFEKGEPTNYCINGIEIPKECGKAEKYKATIILYDNEKSEREEVEYKIYITEKDFENSTPLITIQANMNPEIQFYPDDGEDVSYMYYDLEETGSVIKNDKVLPLSRTFLI